MAEAATEGYVEIERKMPVPGIVRQQHTLAVFLFRLGSVAGIVLCARNFANMFADAQKKGTVVLGLKNIMSAPEMEQAMKDAGLID